MTADVRTRSPVFWAPLGEMYGRQITFFVSVGQPHVLDSSLARPVCSCHGYYEDVLQSPPTDSLLVCRSDSLERRYLRGPKRRYPGCFTIPCGSFR